MELSEKYKENVTPLYNSMHENEGLYFRGSCIPTNERLLIYWHALSALAQTVQDYYTKNVILGVQHR
jgi:hypothetical protein